MAKCNLTKKYIYQNVSDGDEYSYMWVEVII